MQPRKPRGASSRLSVKALCMQRFIDTIRERLDLDPLYNKEVPPDELRFGISYPEFTSGMRRALPREG